MPHRLPAPAAVARRLATAVAVVALSGCDFQAPVDIDLPTYDPLLVVGGFLEAGAPIEVRFGESLPAESGATTGTPWLGPGVLAVLYDPIGQVLDTLVYRPPDPGGIYPRYTSEVVAEPGESYELRATAPGLPSVRASARVPLPVPVTVRSVGLRDIAGVTYESVEAVWTDPEGPTTYALSSRATDERSVNRLRPFVSADPSLREGYSGLGRPREVRPEEGAGPRGYSRAAYLTDEGFDGEVRTVTILFDRQRRNGIGDDVSICLSVLSDEMVRYMRALEVQRSTASDPFVQPTEAYTNVEGGLGAFAGYATSCRDLSL